MTSLEVAALVAATGAALYAIMMGISHVAQSIIVSKATAKKILLEAEARTNAANQDTKMVVDLNNRLTSLQSSRFGLEMGTVVSNEVNTKLIKRKK